MSWSNSGEQMTLDYQGSITLSDDDRDIVSMSPGGFFRLSEDRSRIPLLDTLLGADREIELRGRADGTIERRYVVNRREVAYRARGTPVASRIPSGAGATDRVQRRGARCQVPPA